MLLAQEDHWILTVSGYGAGHRPPTDEAAYLDFVPRSPRPMGSRRSARPSHSGRSSRMASRRTYAAATSA
jgi:hypothetical protein